MIKVFEKRTLQEGARKALRNRLCLPQGQLKAHLQSILGPYIYRVCKHPTIYLYYKNETDILPVASAITFTLYPTDSLRFMVYVKKVYRRQGIGKELVTFAKNYKKTNTLCVQRWDYRSTKFFDSIEVDGPKI